METLKHILIIIYSLYVISVIIVVVYWYVVTTKEERVAYMKFSSMMLVLIGGGIVVVLASIINGMKDNIVNGMKFLWSWICGKLSNKSINGTIVEYDGKTYMAFKLNEDMVDLYYYDKNDIEISDIVTAYFKTVNIKHIKKV